MRKLLLTLFISLALVSTASASNAPTLSEVTPSDNSTGISTNMDISVLYEDADGDTGSVAFYNGNGTELSNQTGISNGTTVTYSPNLDYGETFEWYAVASDGNDTTSNAETSTVSFTTLFKRYTLDDKVIDGVYTGDSFTAASVEGLVVNAGIEENETLDATIKGYNSSEMTQNETFSISDGSNSKTLPSFSENTTTFVVEFEAENGSVVVNNAYVTGEKTDNSPSGIAPNTGGLLTGSFLEGIPMVSEAVNAVSNAFSNFYNFLVEAWTP